MKSASGMTGGGVGKKLVRERDGALIQIQPITFDLRDEFGELARVVRFEQIRVRAEIVGAINIVWLIR